MVVVLCGSYSGDYHKLGIDKLPYSNHLTLVPHVSKGHIDNRYRRIRLSKKLNSYELLDLLVNQELSLVFEAPSN